MSYLARSGFVHYCLVISTKSDRERYTGQKKEHTIKIFGDDVTIVESMVKCRYLIIQSHCVTFALHRQFSVDMTLL